MEGPPPLFSLLLLSLQSIFSPCSSPAQELLSFLPTSFYFSKLPVPKHLQAFDIHILTTLLYIYPFFTQSDAFQITLSLGWTLGDLDSILNQLCHSQQHRFLLLCPFIAYHIHIGLYCVHLLSSLGGGLSCEAHEHLYSMCLY